MIAELSQKFQSLVHTISFARLYAFFVADGRGGGPTNLLLSILDGPTLHRHMYTGNKLQTNKLEAKCSLENFIVPCNTTTQTTQQIFLKDVLFSVHETFFTPTIVWFPGDLKCVRGAATCMWMQKEQTQELRKFVTPTSFFFFFFFFGGGGTFH